MNTKIYLGGNTSRRQLNQRMDEKILIQNLAPDAQVDDSFSNSLFDDLIASSPEAMFANATLKLLESDLVVADLNDLDVDLAMQLGVCYGINIMHTILDEIKDAINDAYNDDERNEDFDANLVSDLIDYVLLSDAKGFSLPPKPVFVHTNDTQEVSQYILSGVKAMGNIYPNFKSILDVLKEYFKEEDKNNSPMEKAEKSLFRNSEEDK